MACLVQSCFGFVHAISHIINNFTVINHFFYKNKEILKQTSNNFLSFLLLTMLSAAVTMAAISWIYQTENTFMTHFKKCFSWRRAELTIRNIETQRLFSAPKLISQCIYTMLHFLFINLEDDQSILFETSRPQQFFYERFMNGCMASLI